MKNLIWFAVILTILFIGCYIITITNKNKLEGFANDDQCSTENPSLTDLGANPLVDRDGQNVIVSPTGGLNNVTSITIDSSGIGWKPVINKKASPSLVVNLKKLIKIHYIVTSGVKLFRVYYSRNDNNVYSYEEVLYQNVNSDDAQSNRASIHFESPSHNEVVRFGNLTTSDGQPVFAKYIKIVPLDIEETSKKGQYKYETTDANTGDNIGENGMKVDIYGMDPESSPIKGGESLMGSAVFYDENGNVMSNSSWDGEMANSDPKLKINFQEDGQTVPRTIYSIIFTSTNKSKNQYVQELSITYQHHKSKLTETIYNIKGNTNCGDTNRIQYYFPHPIIATTIFIKPTKLAKSNRPPSLKIVDIMGSKVNEVQEKVLLDKNKNKYCSSDEPDGCGSVSDLLGKQAEIQQLCDSLELQDRIKENNQRIDKNRQYLLQLEDQDQKIAKLEAVIDQMKHLRSLRQKTNDQGMQEQKEKQDKLDQQLAQLVAERKEKQKQFQIKLNIGQQSLDNLAKNVQKIEKEKGLEKGDDTQTTSIEGFDNPHTIMIHPDPNMASQKFLNKKFAFVENEHFTNNKITKTKLEDLGGYATFNPTTYKNKIDSSTYHFCDQRILNKPQDAGTKFVKEHL
jgi:hypothetical protein